jgi:hypothetical protein
MILIAIPETACNAINATSSPGSVVYKAEVTAKGRELDLGRHGHGWITRILTAKASDSVFVAICTISAASRPGRRSRRLRASADRRLDGSRLDGSGVDHQKQRA